MHIILDNDNISTSFELTLKMLQLQYLLGVDKGCSHNTLVYLKLPLGKILTPRFFFFFFFWVSGDGTAGRARGGTGSCVCMCNVYTVYVLVNLWCDEYICVLLYNT